jgi:cbb3-type cytochrome oxidase subunit 3
MKSLCFRLAPVAVLLAPLVAAAHPGHDDPDITWDLDHLVEHPFATILCFSVIGAGVWFAWRLAKRTRAEREQRARR